MYSYEVVNIGPNNMFVNLVWSIYEASRLPMSIFKWLIYPDLVVLDRLGVIDVNSEVKYFKKINLHALRDSQCF